jgi:SH3-like domain-containing protein
MFSKLFSVGILGVFFATQVLVGMTGAAPEMVASQSLVVQTESAPTAVTGTTKKTTTTTYVYKSASTGSKKLLKLTKGKQVKALRTKGSFTQVSASGKTGYVLSKHLKTPPVLLKSGAVMQANAKNYLYKSASTGSKKLATLNKGAQVKVRSDNGTWTKVTVGSKTGYVRRSSLTTPPKKPAIKAGAVAKTNKKTYIQSKASSSSTKVLALSAGKQVSVKSVSGGWAKVSASGKTGYTPTAHLTTVTPAKATPKPTAKPSTASVVMKASSKTTAQILTDQVSKNVVRVKLLSHTGKKLKVMVTLGSKTSYYDLAARSDTQSFPLNLGTGTYKVSVLENISGTSYKYVVSQNVAVSGSSNSAYLISTYEVNFNSSMAPVQKAKSLASGKSDSDKVKAIYNWVINNVSYDYNKKPASGYVPDIVTTYNTKKGICYDFAALFAAMLRSQGVPTKMCKGYASGVSGYHAWNEVYVNGAWHTVDTSYDSQVKGSSMYKSSGYNKTSQS